MKHEITWWAKLYNRRVTLNVTPKSTCHQDEIFLSRWIGGLSHCGRYAKASVIRSEKSLGFCHLIGRWRAETEEALPPPRRSLCHIITFRNGDVRREAECDAGGQVDGWRNVNLLNEFLHARCSPIIGICLRVLAEVTSKHPVPSAVPACIVLGDCLTSGSKG